MLRYGKAITAFNHTSQVVAESSLNSNVILMIYLCTMVSYCSYKYAKKHIQSKKEVLTKGV